MKKMRKLLTNICWVPFLFSCSVGSSGYISTYSFLRGACITLSIIEGMSWNTQEITILLANLYYSICYDGVIRKTLEYNFESIVITMHDSEKELGRYDVDMAMYSSYECAIVMDNTFNHGKEPKASDFKLSYPFDLSSTISKDTESVYFLVTYKEVFSDGDSRTFSRRFNAVVKRKKQGFTLTGVGVNF